jgi:NAD(P)-dependent dehydrogenase (short-subunit alcohol dehydrogenase family)
MHRMFDLQGKTILVTGGTRGIGRAISSRFASAGATVIANFVRDQKAADQLQTEAQESGWRLEVCRADITSPAGVDRLMGLLVDRYPTLSGFVHNAATGVHKPIEELTLRHFDWTFSLNVRAFFGLLSRLLPRMVRGSSILVLSSAGAERSVHQYSLIGSSKGALEALARHLAVELAPRGIRVNVLSPGSVPTDSWKAMPRAQERLTEEARRSPLGRLVTFEEVACAAQFLCSDAASGIVGQTLIVDGGSRIVSGA